MNPNYLPPETQREILDLRDQIVADFDRNDWVELGVQTACIQVVQGHGRLLRSLAFGDPDYPTASTEVLLSIVRTDPDNLRIVKEAVQMKMGVLGENISTTKSTGRMIQFRPSVFHVPEGNVESDLVAVMMPFALNFEPVYDAISAACKSVRLRSLRAKDIWQHEAVIQDIFSLIFRSTIVICDFTGRNPNVFYEAGIAHALGKHVVPITQSANDIPFDLQHNRYLSYLSNSEGLEAMKKDLASRLAYLASNN